MQDDEDRGAPDGAFAAPARPALLHSSRNAKLTLCATIFRQSRDPDRGWALAALTGALSFAAAKPAAIRALVERRMDPVLFGWSYDYVGDLAETVALVWPAPAGGQSRASNCREVVDALSHAARAEVRPGLIEGWLDALDADGRWALLKLLTGALRVGLSARLAKQAAGRCSSGARVTEIEEVWHALAPPYEDLFAWLEGRAERPDPPTRRAASAR